MSKQSDVEILEESTVVLLSNPVHLTTEDEARKYLADLKKAWARRLAERQLTMHSELRPHAHMGQECQPGRDCHTRKIINLADPEVRL